MVVSHRGEDAGDRHGFYPSLQPFKESGRRFPVKGGQLFSVVFEAASHNRVIHGDFLYVFFPVYHWRYSQRSGGADPKDSDRRQGFPLHNGVRTLGGSQHGLADLRPVDPGRLQAGADCAKDAVIDIAGSRILHFRYHISVIVDQNRVRIGASNVNS